MDYKIADIALAAWGHKEIAIAEHEMPGLMASSSLEECKNTQPLAGARIVGSLHMTIQTAVLVKVPGNRTGCHSALEQSCNIFSTQDQAAAAIGCTEAFLCLPGKARPKRSTGGALNKLCAVPDGWTPNMILDDGHDLTGYIHDRHPDLHCLASEVSQKKPQQVFTNCWNALPPAHYLIPAINVNDSVTKTKFDNLYGCRESLVDAIKRATDVMIAGKVAVVVWLRRRGQRKSAQALRALSAQVWVTEADPICAHYRLPWKASVSSPWTMPADKADIFVTATGNIGCYHTSSTC
jgi:adenosylhomocysteinase